MMLQSRLFIYYHLLQSDSLTAFYSPSFSSTYTQVFVSKDLFSTTLPRRQEALSNETIHREMGISAVTSLCNKLNKCVD